MSNYSEKKLTKIKKDVNKIAKEIENTSIYKEYIHNNSNTNNLLNDNINDNKKYKSKSYDTKIYFNKKTVSCIIDHFKDISLIKYKSIKDKENNTINTNNTDNTNILNNSINTNTNYNLFDDNRYVYCIKKLKLFPNYHNKELLKKYELDKTKALRDRCIRNEAEELPRKTYKIIDNNNIQYNSVTIEIEYDTNNINTNNINNSKNIFTLKKVDAIEYFEIESYDRSEFEYAVYKFGDDITAIARYMDMPIKKAILLFYVFHFQFRLTESLCEVVAVREWCKEDREVFAECYKKHGNMTLKNITPAYFKDYKTEKDLSLYYYYHNNQVINSKWSQEERGVFQELYKIFRKDWEMYTEKGISIINDINSNIHNTTITDNDITYNTIDKDISDIKSYYNNYYKRLSDKELVDDENRFTYRMDISLIDKIEERYSKLDRKKRKKKVEDII